MAMIQLPIPLLQDAEIDALKASIVAEHRIEVPIHGWPVPAARESPDAMPAAVVARISAQLYNDRADYDRLADALVGRLLSPSPGARRRRH
jgi:selenocysteine lyase/cysteine desulfurase